MPETGVSVKVAEPAAAGAAALLAAGALPAVTGALSKSLEVIEPPKPEP